jgi:hypothetical protein
LAHFDKTICAFRSPLSSVLKESCEKRRERHHASKQRDVVSCTHSTLLHAAGSLSATVWSTSFQSELTGGSSTPPPSLSELRCPALRFVNNRYYPVGLRFHQMNHDWFTLRRPCSRHLAMKMAPTQQL